jgi:hypothetical protein
MISAVLPSAMVDCFDDFRDLDFDVTRRQSVIQSIIKLTR